jgi:hypothetical protein
MRIRFATEVVRDNLFPRRNKRWNYVSSLLDRPLRGAELGVRGGRFASHLLAAHKELHLFAIDLWGDRIDQSEFQMRTASYADRVTAMQMSTAAAAPKIEDESLDFIFVDANHEYEGVTADIAAWTPKVVKGGWITGHDYCDKFPGVMRAVHEHFEVDRIEVGPDTVWAVRKL